MNRFVISPRDLAAWASASLLMLLPLLLALDRGGVMYWTQFVMSLVVAVAFCLAIPSLFGRENSRGLGKHLLLGLMILWGLFAMLQTLPLPGAITGLLSPASAAAYSTLLNDLVPADQQRSFYPVTINAYWSGHAVAMLWVYAAVVWTSAVVFSTRVRITALLTSIALTGSLIAVTGIAVRMVPQWQPWGLNVNMFGPFVNRNNAALLLNLGLACGLGSLAWRISALTGQDVDDPEFELSDLVSLTSDRQSIIGMSAIILCGAGLVIGGSRGGVVAALAGFLLAFGWVRQKRGVSTLPVVIAALAVGIGVLTIPTNLTLESIQRLQFDASGNRSTILRDGRLQHWPDGLRTAVAHLPGGSGLATYGSAYLPHQSSDAAGWFEHADNLWLELLVEQGVVGIVLALLAVGVIIWSLSQLTESGDAIDHGIRIAGWFGIGAVLTSQLFDFGLILPACATCVAILYPAILNRSFQANHVSTNTKSATRVLTRDADASPSATNDPIGTPVKGRRSLFERKRTILSSWALPLVCGVPLLLSIVSLRDYALDESIVDAAASQYQNAQFDVDALEQVSQRLEDRLESRPSPKLYAMARQYEQRLARFREVEAAAPTSERQTIQYFTLTSAANRGIGDVAIRDQPSWLRAPGVKDLYAKPLQLARQELQTDPLSRAARWTEVELDFVHGDEALASAALKQLIRFYNGDAQRLITMGRQAVELGDFALATECFNRSVTLWPFNGRYIFADLVANPQLKIADCFPPGPAAYRHIADLAVQEATSPARALPIDSLRHIRDKMECEACDSVEASVMCSLQSARLNFGIADHEAAFRQYEAVIQLRPREAVYRIEYITKLMLQDERKVARLNAQIGLSMFPDDARFQGFIDELKRRDLGQAPVR